MAITDNIKLFIMGNETAANDSTQKLLQTVGEEEAALLIDRKQ